jgi:hypothetical protein
MHPAVIKAKRLARVAVENGWTGSIDSDTENDCRITVLKANRKNSDESICVEWTNNSMSSAVHSLMDGTVSFQLPCAKSVSTVFAGWPDVMHLIKVAPVEERLEIVKRYRKLPFDWENDTDEYILSKLIGTQIFWYNHVSAKIYSDNVLVPKKGKKNHIEIKPIGHRKMLNFIGSHAGFASVMLDSILKVG